MPQFSTELKIRKVMATEPETPTMPTTLEDTVPGDLPNSKNSTCSLKTS